MPITSAAHYNCIYSRQKKYYSIKAFFASFPYQGVTIAAHSLGANKEATVTLPWWGRERELNSFDRYIYQIIFFFCSAITTRLLAQETPEWPPMDGKE